MIRLSNVDARFIARLLELRRSALLEIRQRLPEPSARSSRAVELSRLDQLIGRLKAALPQAAEREILEADLHKFTELGTGKPVVVNPSQSAASDRPMPRITH
jgi:hypothetical protein